LVHRERATPEPFSQTLPFETFADEEGRPSVLPNVVHSENVRVIKSPGRARFLLESTESIGIAGKVGQTHFDRHVAPESLFVGAPDLPRAARAEQPLDMVGANTFTRPQA